MMTLYDLLAIVCLFMGIAFGSLLGHIHILLGVLGAVAGGFAGWRIGRVPTRRMVTDKRRKMLKYTNDELVKRLYDRQYFDSECLTPNFLLQELRTRGEDVQGHVDLVLDLLECDSPIIRACGYGAMLSVYPHFQKYIRGYRADKSIEDCRMRVARLREKLERTSGEAENH